MSMTASHGEIEAFKALPQKLKDYRQWVVWTLVQKEGKPKPDKIPIDPHTHSWASVSNSETWGTFDEAMATFVGFPAQYLGIGFVITEADPFAFIDLDNVRTTDGWDPLVSDTLGQIPSWAEFSQSGDGIHILAEASGPTVKTKGIELYQYGRFVALTGRHIPTTPLEITACQKGVDWLRDTVLAQGGDAVKQAAPAPRDPRMVSFERIGLAYTFKATGKAEMECPWGHEHGNGDPNGAVYMPAHFNGRALANFYCQHATCQGEGRSNIAALDAWLGQNDSEYHAGTLADAFADIPAETPTSGRGPLFLDAMQLLARGASTPRWVVKGLVERGQVGLVYGASQSLKSYVSLDLATAVSTGRSWHGFDVRAEGDVLFLAGEGNHGLISRLDALRQFQKIHPDELSRLHLSSRGLDLMEDGDLFELAAVAKQIGRVPTLLIVDTLSRNALIDENSAKDVSALVARCTTIALQWDCAVLIVHHTGKGKGDARGSSALTANTDCRFKIERKDMPGRIIAQMTIEKLKSAPEPDAPVIFEAKVVQLIGVVDEDGVTQSNLALARIESEYENIPAEDRVKVTSLQAGVLSLAQQCIIGSRSLSSLAETAGVSKRDLWEVCVASDTLVDLSRRSFAQAIEDLVGKGLLILRDTEATGVWYFLPEK